MSVKHIENLTVTNFKCFKHLEVMELGRVNLIGGKNNVGKTAFLEAVELFLSSIDAHDLNFMIHYLLLKRQNENEHFELDFFYNSQELIKISSNLGRYIEIKWVAKNKKKSSDNFTESDIILSSDNMNLLVVIDSYKSEKEVSIHEFIKPYSRGVSTAALQLDGRQPIAFISSEKSKEINIAILLGRLINLNREEFLNQSLSLFDIIAIKQITTQYGVVLKLKIKNQDKLVLLSSLGEGVNRYIAIICAIWANKDGFLLIDEIENGIHYTNYKKLWQIIFQASLDANCQLFITTHSKECISAFNDVQFEIENCSAQYYEFYRNLKNDLITASALDKDQLRYELTHEGRVRGE